MNLHVTGDGPWESSGHLVWAGRAGREASPRNTGQVPGPGAPSPAWGRVGGAGRRRPGLPESRAMLAAGCGEPGGGSLVAALGAAGQA